MPTASSQPLQAPSKVDPANGVAVSTIVDWYPGSPGPGKLEAQTGSQSIPGGLLVTFPSPVPALFTLTTPCITADAGAAAQAPRTQTSVTKRFTQTPAA